MRRRLSLPQQAFALKGAWPQGQLSLRPCSLDWRSSFTPTPISLDYHVEITYRIGRFPRVVVLDELKGRPGENLPHIYRDGSLCLYEEGQWKSRMLIAHTIVPWTAEWLAHYELWLTGGTWHGNYDVP